MTNYNAVNLGTVSLYTLGTDGALTPTAAQAASTGKRPARLVFDGTGRYAYVPNIMDDDISQYSVPVAH